MPDVTWRGSRMPSAVATALREREITIGRGSDEPATGPTVVFTAGARRLPRCDADDRWIWLCGATVGESLRLEAALHGAYDVISLGQPDAMPQLLHRIEELLVPTASAAPAAHIVTVSAAARAVAAQVARVAPTSMSVLLTGETGTGKEVMARLIHAWSPRAKKPFIPINCAAIPNELMEAELFGYARGAFSGAVQKYDGQLMAAEGGTVLLDEIDDTPLETQVKLLRVLEDHVVSRLGENAWHAVDFRLLASTNRDLEPLIDAGLFGADLYERLAIVTIHLLSLRERLDDLPDLARLFVARFADEQKRPAVTDIRSDALRALRAYPWPGNVRELRNVMYETLVYKRGGTEVLLSDLPKRILTRGRDAVRESAATRLTIAAKLDAGTMNLRKEVAALERVALNEALKRTGGNAAQAARLLGEVGRGASRDPGGTLRAMKRRLSTS